jgi:hypothetical protein
MNGKNSVDSGGNVFRAVFGTMGYTSVIPQVSEEGRVTKVTN